MTTLIETGRISRSWQVHPFGRIVVRSKESGQPELQPLSVYLDAGVIPRSSRGDNFNRLGDDMSKYLVVKKGDIVFNKLRTWQGGFGVSRYEGVVSPAYFVCHPRTDVDSNYLHYLLHSSTYLAELTRVSKFMPPSQFDILWDDLRRIPIIVPPIDEQRAIADYLDRETARINALIEKKQRMVEVLEERIDCLILQRIGESALAGSMFEVSTVPIRQLLTKVSRPALAEGEMITAFRDGQVVSRLSRRSEGYTESWTDNASVQGVLAGDVVVHGLDGFAGAIGTSEVDGVCSPVYHVCETRQEGNPLYLGRMLRVLAVSGYLGLFASSTRERAVDFRNWYLFGRIPVPDVDPVEQRMIGRLIEMVTPLKTAVGRSTLLAMEYRQALITAAVTGELDIDGKAA